MSKISKWFKNKAKEIALEGNLVTIDASELADLRLRALDNAQKPKEKPLTRAQLTQLQLGSYIPDFESLEKKPDAFKSALGALCATLDASPEWQYLITHLKQDQVNASFFTEGVKHTDDFVRGSVNGIYVVDDMVHTLGLGHEANKKKGLGGKTEGKAEKPKA